jgi:hypothetical protein
MCFLSLTGYTGDGGYEKRKRVYFNSNKIFKGNEDLILVTLNCTLLHNQDDGWTMP